VVFESEEQAIRVAMALKENGIVARRYFYPSLDEVACLDAPAELSVSRSIASRILCLPIYSQLAEADQNKIVYWIKAELEL